MYIFGKKIIVITAKNKLTNYKIIKYSKVKTYKAALINKCQRNPIKKLAYVVRF